MSLSFPLCCVHSSRQPCQRSHDISSEKRSSTTCNSGWSGSDSSGSTTTYRLEPLAGSVAEIENIDGDAQCGSVCSNGAGSLVFSDGGGEERCQIEGLEDWLSVSPQYQDACSSKETCAELEVVQACDGYMNLEGKYIPYDDECPAADASKSIYRSADSNEDGKYSWLF